MLEVKQLIAGNANPSLNIASTNDDALYVTERYRMSAYNIDVPNGEYDVVMHFAETYNGITGSGQRVFDVLIEGQTILNNFDIYAQAGFATAVAKTARVNVNDGQLKIDFVGIAEEPLINAIEVKISGGGLIGDTNGDGKVNLADLIIFIANFGKTGGFEGASDVNSDGKVNLFDIVLVAKNMGNVGSSGHVCGRNGCESNLGETCSNCPTDCGPCAPECTDSDNDGYSREDGSCGAVDCDDTNAGIYPGANEVCDGVDNDCDGQIDEGCAPLCTEADWQYSDGMCQPSNTLIRSWTLIGDCVNGVSHPDTEPISCIYNPNQIQVSTSSELRNAISSASPGDEIIVADGVYTGTFSLSRSGTQNAMIAVKARNQGGATFRNADIRITGDYILLKGFIIEEQGLDVTGDYNTITRNILRNANGNPAIYLKNGASYNRISYNEITNWNGGGVKFLADNVMTSNRVDHNYIHDNLQVANDEAIRIGTGRTQTFFNLGTIVEYNLLEGIATDNNAEIISVKSSGNIIRANTFKDSPDNVLSLRHGVNNLVKNNVLINIKLGDYGDNHKIIGNHVINANIQIVSGTCTQEDVPTGGGCYPVARNWLVAGNIVENGKILVGKHDRQYPVENIILAGNQAEIQLQNEVNTQILPTYDGDPGVAVLVTPDMVGPNAPGD